MRSRRAIEFKDKICVDLAEFAYSESILKNYIILLP